MQFPELLTSHEAPEDQEDLWHNNSGATRFKSAYLFLSLGALLCKNREQFAFFFFFFLSRPSLQFEPCFDKQKNAPLETGAKKALLSPSRPCTACLRNGATVPRHPIWIPDLAPTSLHSFFFLKEFCSILHLLRAHAAKKRRRRREKRGNQKRSASEHFGFLFAL